MKRMLIAAGLAGALTLTLATASIASATDPSTLPEAPHNMKCAVWKGDPGIRHHKPSELVGRECEAYWMNDTAEDERELALAERAAAASGATNGRHD